MESTSSTEVNSPQVIYTEEQLEELKCRIESELETLESIYVDEGVVQQQPKVATVVKTKVNETVSDEQAQAEAELINAKILEAAQKQHISATAVFRVPKGKKTSKKPQ